MTPATLVITIDLRGSDAQFNAGIDAIITACIFAQPVMGVFLCTGSSLVLSIQQNRVKLALEKLAQAGLSPPLRWVNHHSATSGALQTTCEVLGEPLASKAFREMLREHTTRLLNF